MCGIVGYIGSKNAARILLNGLHRLEYRGYDSAGMALVNNGNLNIYKCAGRVADLEKYIEGKDTSATIGIAHTRWATHGEPNDCNAHPHVSQSGRIALVHNGIIENYRVLKEALTAHGYTFHSTTDSEVFVNLIEYIRTSNNCTLLEAVQQAIKQVVGAYAIAVVDRDDPDQLIAVRQSSPLVVGIGDNEYFISSDAASVIEHTNDFVYLNDGEIAVIPRRGHMNSNLSARYKPGNAGLSLSGKTIAGIYYKQLFQPMKKKMTLSTDRKSASEGEYIEIKWACDACPDSLYLAIDSEQTQYSIAVSDSGTTRIPVPKSNGKMTIRLLGVISGKKVTESIEVRVKSVKQVRPKAPISSRMKTFSEKMKAKWYVFRANMKYWWLSQKKWQKALWIALLALWLGLIFSSIDRKPEVKVSSDQVQTAYLMR